jgi:hypothetical protein
MTNSSDNPDCLNCGTPLRGQYCANCGQRSRTRLISLWQLLKEAFGDLFELDSRLWRTLGPLLSKPGLLTKDYLLGRRARYMPPFRTYLVLSVVFFVVAFFSPSEELSLLLIPEQAPVVEEITATSESPAAIPDAANDQEFTVKTVGSENCEGLETEDWSAVPEWLAKRMTPGRVKRLCERISFDEGKTFQGLLLDNIPVALIFLMPLMALMMKVLYPLSRRYFVEHLLFFVHFHAFFFLILILQILFTRIMTLLPLPGVVTILAVVATSFYIPVYLYLAMRRVYGQRHRYTVIKYVALFITYLIGAALTLLGAIAFALLAV